RARAEHEAAQARARAEAMARAEAEAARLRAEQEARARAEHEAAQARARAEAEAARLKAEHEAALAKAKEEAETKARAAAEEARLDAEQSEPSYKAFYHLKNASPSYPFAARRMGLQGKVILNVEVLADGSCGQVNVAQSSGHKILDNNALETVRTWQFIPARRAGEAVNKWFKVPIVFSLKDNET
ncbi:MAG: energy transducer TonB, partial [Candidatus Nitrotoga sp.]